MINTLYTSLKRALPGIVMFAPMVLPLPIFRDFLVESKNYCMFCLYLASGIPATVWLNREHRAFNGR
jgi:hypothetical protein